ncbi:MAG: hypothetical protein QW774_01375 [Candidatus Micrarchaeaceae archaeon]
MAKKKTALKEELEKFRRTQEINSILARGDAQSRALLETAGEGNAVPSEEIHAANILENYGGEKEQVRIGKTKPKAKAAIKRPAYKAKPKEKKKRQR